MTEATQIKEKPRLRQLCSTIALERGLDPIGGAYGYDYILIMEAPLPWPETKFDEPGVLPQDVLDLFSKVLFVSYPTQWMNVCMAIVAPDKGYSVPGMRHVIYGRRPPTPFAGFEKQEYLVPEEMMGALVWALFARPEELPSFERWRQTTDNVRDICICTDGVIDRACAVVGMKLYSTLRKMPEAQPGGSVRVWKTSHFGGHVYAATVITLPDGRMWGFLDGNNSPQLLQRQGDIQALRGCYRGWFGAPSPFVDVVERELMMRHGWAWFDFVQQGTLVAEDPDAPVNEYGDRQPQWGEVELRYRSPDGQIEGRATGKVVVSHHVETYYASDRESTHPYPQYRIDDFTVEENGSRNNGKHIEFGVPGAVE